MSCVESQNVICKHERARKTFYVNLDNVLPPDVTVESVIAVTEDPALTIIGVTVIAADMIIDDGDCPAAALQAGRALLIVLADGTASDEEVIVTVEWEQSDGDTDARDLRLFING